MGRFGYAPFSANDAPTSRLAPAVASAETRKSRRCNIAIPFTHDTNSSSQRSAIVIGVWGNFGSKWLTHVLEKWAPVFRVGHASTLRRSARIPIQPNRDAR